MTDKIIINGVDVSGCEHIDCDCANCEIFANMCHENPNCYYKQLKRKEQECKEIKQYTQGVDDFWQSLMVSFNVLKGEKIKLEQEREQLKEQLFSFMNGDYCANGCSLKQQLDQLNEKLHIAEEGLKDYLKHYNKQCKQLDQLKAEVELLRQYKGSKQASYETMQREWNEAKNEVKKLKAEIEELEYIIANKSCLTYRDFKCTKAYYTDKRLKQALQEIKKIVKKAYDFHYDIYEIKMYVDELQDILNKISEVEDGV